MPLATYGATGAVTPRYLSVPIALILFYPLCNDCFRRYERFGEPAPPTAWQRTRTKVVLLTPVPDVAEIIDLVTDFVTYRWEP